MAPGESGKRQACPWLPGSPSQIRGYVGGRAGEGEGRVHWGLHIQGLKVWVFRGGLGGGSIQYS